MEDIATHVGMSKRTVYARYADKSALFKAAIHRAIQRYTVPRATIDALATNDLEATLTAVARLRIANLSTPVATKLQRILNAQSYRFPELFNASFEEGTSPTIHFLCDLFTHATARGELNLPEPRRAAAAFLSLVVGGPARIILSGQALDEQEIATRIRFAVRLFLDGARPR